MAAPTARYVPSDFARRGQEIYDRVIKPKLNPEDVDKFVAIDIQSGEYEIDRDDHAAIERIRARRPDAKTWLMRVGAPTAYRFGWRSIAGESV